MKILASGDLHGDIGLAKRLAERAEKEKVDLVVLCGFCLGFSGFGYLFLKIVFGGVFLMCARLGGDFGCDVFWAVFCKLRK